MWLLPTKVQGIWRPNQKETNTRNDKRKLIFFSGLDTDQIIYVYIHTK